MIESKMPENTPKVKPKDYSIHGPILTRRQYTPEIIKTYQNRLLTCFSEKICSITPEDQEKFYSQWKKQLQIVDQRQPKTYRLGIVIQHANNLICPHPFVEINHSFSQQLKNYFDFSKFYRQANSLTDIL
ncbi:MAG: hypothetical protein US68_C0005G0022 [Candidatus Shapirobacteria bacterium GW2011_GWE1_38_10]|uniref:Uncharacterized protein n=1 Tax=Candidatus Shapirobacteria bacterium GW2011_GWE1_38_10 TaxID=1618488 RepID=A0A0G0IHG6_9BACT|nr:MAG: hypothetical protein US46_C0001G0015 [Candidatus Shapirobacteria bacterium GW2011_GWF2_37_20]KKQ50455.1 MAG: hypothetical protein US68_C0005G0022 [Candidatus Shapirobacteria bacterium GW2011_GWE1_38_10]